MFSKNKKDEGESTPNQTIRIIALLRRLSMNSNKNPVEVKDVAAEYYEKKYSESESSAKRMAQDDLKYLKTIFEKDIVCVRRGCYILENEELANSFFSSEMNSLEYKKFFEFIILFSDKMLDSITNERLKLYISKLREDKEQIYSIRMDAIEDLSNKDIMNELKKAIIRRRYIDLKIYEDDNLLSDNNDKNEALTDVQPYRIVFTQGNWYLAIFDKNTEVNNGFRFLRIGKITNIDIKSNTFQKNQNIEKFIENFQSIFSYFKKEPFDVVLKVSPEVSKFFIQKKFFVSQKIVEPKFEDGSIRVHYSINNKMEILPLVKKWLPDIEIISPSWLRDIYYEDISKMLQKMQMQ